MVSRSEGKPLLRCNHTARCARTDHEAVGGFEFLLATFLTQIAIILLVAAVELDQRGVVRSDRAGMRIAEALAQGAA